jgi:hypothetical protein
MTEKHDRDDPEKASAEGEGPTGIVGEIREEIAEAVTHVPKSVRWTIGKLVRVTLLAFGLLVVLLVVTAILFVMNRTEWVASELTLILNQTLSLRSDVQLSIADLKGNPLSQITLLEPSVRFKDGDSTPIIEAPAITLRYSPWKLITGRRGIDITIDSPVVRIAAGPDGRPRLPIWRSGTASTAVTTYDVRLRVTNGTVHLPGQTLPVSGLFLDTSLHTGRPTRVEVDDLRWVDAPRVGRLDQMRGSLSAGDSVQFVIDEVRMPDVALSARGGWEASADNRPKARRMHVQIDRVRWTWLAKAFINDAFDAPGEGAASVELLREPDGRYHGRFLAQADWKGLRADGSGDFRLEGNHLVVSPADAVSSAGRIAGMFEMKGKAWTLTGDVEDGDPAQWGALGLVDWPQGSLNGRFRYDTAVDGAARILADLGASELAGWRADSARVNIESWPARPDSFRVDFLRDGGAVRLVAETRDDGWSGDWTAGDFPLEEWPDGRATGLTGRLGTGAGRVRGVDGTLFVEGMIEGPHARWLGADVGPWRLDGIDGRLLPTPDLVARGRTGSLGFLGIDFDSVAASLHLGDATMDIDTLRAFAGDTLIEMDAVAAWDEGGWQLTAPRALARSDHFDWNATPPLALSGDPRGVTFDRLIAKDGDATLAIRGRFAGPEGIHSFHLEGEGLVIARLGLPLEWNLSGVGDATLDITGPARDPLWRFEGTAAGAGARATVTDSLHLVLTGRRHALTIERAMVGVREGRLEGRLAIQGASAAWPDSLIPESVVAWLADAARWDGEWRADRFPIDGWGGLSPALARAGGRLGGRVGIGGSPSRPAFDAGLRAAPFAFDAFTLDDVEIQARYRDGRLEVPDARFSRGSVTSTGSGAMALELALGRTPVVPERPMDWRVDIPNGDLGVLPLIVPQVAWAEGDFRLNSTIRGTPRAPILDGSLDVDHGQLRIAAREEILRDLTARCRFDAARVTLDTLFARQGRNGIVRGGGEVQLDGFKVDHYRFDLEMSDFTALESGLYSATFDGRFAITDGSLVHGERLPHVVGDIEIIQAAILLDFTNEEAMRQFTSSEQPLFWTYRVHLRATDKLRWTPPNANVEFSADLVLEQSPDSLSAFGDIDALRGQYWFLSNRFDVDRANLQFDNVGGMDPLLDIEARTVLTPTSFEAAAAIGEDDEASGRLPRQTIVVNITGRSRNPVLEFSSSPHDLGQPVILKELTIQRFAGENPLQGDPLDDFVTRAINRQLSTEMSKLFQGYVSDWALTRESGGLLSGEGELYAEVGIPLSAQWNLRYRQRVPGRAIGEYNVNPYERDLEVEYRLNRFFYVTSELAQRKPGSGSTSTTQGAPEFNVNLKARWEY